MATVSFRAIESIFPLYFRTMRFEFLAGDDQWWQAIETETLEHVRPTSRKSKWIEFGKIFQSADEEAVGTWGEGCETHYVLLEQVKRLGRW